MITPREIRQARAQASQPWACEHSLLAEHTGDQEDAACRDVDSLSDWISAACMGQPVLPWQPRRTPAFDFTVATTALLAALSFDTGQPSPTRLAAMDELRRRYLASTGAQKWMVAA